MTKPLLLVVVVLLLAAVAVLTQREAEPAELTIVASRSVTEQTAWPVERQPDLGANFGQLVAAMKPKPKPKARTAPTRAALFNAAYATDVAGVVRDVFARFGAAVVEKALRVFWCESRLTPTATNGQHVGVAQLARRWQEARARRLGFTWSQMWEARPNLLVAADLFAEQGWGPWQCA